MQITDILAQTGGLQSMARELGVSEAQAASGAAALAPGDPRRIQEAGAVTARGPRRARRPARATRRRRPARRRAGAAADGREPRQRRARTDLRLQGREPHGRAERGFAVGARPGPAQEDAADAGDAGGRLHGEAARRRRAAQARPRQAVGSAACWAACSAARPPAPAAPRQAPRQDSPRCSTWTATAIRWTTSCGWPARRSVDRQPRSAGELTPSRGVST